MKAKSSSGERMMSCWPRAASTPIFTSASYWKRNSRQHSFQDATNRSKPIKYRRALSHTDYNVGGDVPVCSVFSTLYQSLESRANSEPQIEPGAEHPWP